MDDKPKLLTGILFKNKFKDNDKKPDLCGKFEIQEDLPKGTVLRVACWAKESKGKKIISVFSDTILEDDKNA